MRGSTDVVYFTLAVSVMVRAKASEIFCTVSGLQHTLKLRSHLQSEAYNNGLSLLSSM